MPKGIPGSGPRIKQKRLEAKAQRGNPNIRNEGADGPEAPKPSQGSEAVEVKLPPAVQTARAETAKLVAQAIADRKAERDQKATMARVKSFQVGGNDLGWIAAFVGTAGQEIVRERLAKDAGIVAVENGHFYITRADRGGQGSDFARPTVWFECEVDDSVSKAAPVGGSKPVDSDDDEVIF